MNSTKMIQVDTGAANSKELGKKKIGQWIKDLEKTGTGENLKAPANYSIKQRCQT